MHDVSSVEKRAMTESKDEAVILEQPVVSRTKSSSDDVSSWSRKKVRDFFVQRNLTGMLPLCDGINGEELSTLYGMCQMRPSSMYRSLKFELLHGHHRLLPISTYVRFIHQMRTVCPNSRKSHDAT